MIQSRTGFRPIEGNKTVNVSYHNTLTIVCRTGRVASICSLFYVVCTTWFVEAILCVHYLIAKEAKGVLLLFITIRWIVEGHTVYDVPRKGLLHGYEIQSYCPGIAPADRKNMPFSNSSSSKWLRVTSMKFKIQQSFYL